MDYHYANKYLVGYGEMDLNGKCKMSCILNYLQEIATLHSKKHGYGTEEMLNLKMGWLILSWKVKILSYPLPEEEIEIRTWSRGFKGLHAKRGYEIYNNKSELIVVADSNWVLFDLEKQKPIKVLPEMEKAYGTIERSPFEDDEIVKISMPERIDSSLEYTTMRHDIDTNKHVNNIRYVDLAISSIPDEVYNNKVIEKIDVQYRKQGFYNEKLTITNTKISENEYINAILNENKEVCMIARSIWK